MNILARQYYTYFPSVLDLNQTTFEVGYTSKIRTKQTADAFVKSLASQQVGNISQAELGIHHRFHYLHT